MTTTVAEHRRFLNSFRPAEPADDHGLFRRAGGRASIDRLIDALYDRIESDSRLRPLFFGRDLTNERAAQKRFFSEWLGSEAQEYSERAYLPLKHRHDLLPITKALAGRWLSHFRVALDQSVKDKEARDLLYERTAAFAMAMVNEENEDAPSELRAKPHGSCLRYKPAAEALALARRGETVALRRLIKASPDVLRSEVHAAAMLHAAVAAGHSKAAELLLDSGVDVNKPSAIDSGRWPLILVTPLCAARVKKRKALEELLVERDAKEDVFTHAFLGDLTALEKERADAQLIDPAVDALTITPVHHAVAGRKPDALRLLLVSIPAGAPPLTGGLALRDAADHEDAAMVTVLVDRGVSASALGAGRWVLHPEIAPMLSRAGAKVDRSGSWIGLCCTGNQGRKDDPDLVAALLEHGANVNDKRTIGQGTDGGHATALHYAAKAGFVKTIALLIERGADPKAVDDNGMTPLDWLSRASKSVDRAAVKKLLLTRATRDR